MTEILGICTSDDGMETLVSFPNEGQALTTCGIFNNTYFSTIRREIKRVFGCSSDESCVERIGQRGSSIVFVWKENFVAHVNKVMREASLREKEGFIVRFRSILTGILDNTIRRGGMSSTVDSDLYLGHGGGGRFRALSDGGSGKSAYAVRN